MANLMEFINCRLFLLVFLIFLGFCFILTALLMILTESAVHSILYLMFLFLYLTELTIILRMEFLALIFLIVYIGAVCVLMLFHIKLIKTFVHRFDNIHNNSLFLPFLIVSIFLPFVQILTLGFEKVEDEFTNNLSVYKILFSQLKNLRFSYNYNDNYNTIEWINTIDFITDTEVLGYLLYNIYFIYLIIGSFILLVAMIGSIFLTLLKKKVKKFQQIDQQIFIDISKNLILK